MNVQSAKVHIVGGGVSGLVAAIVLEKNGFSPVIIEATDRVGGRVKTDLVEHYQLDHGFQVLLTAYPAAKKYLDFQALDLQAFLPGATTFFKGSQKTIGDPLRAFSLLMPTLCSGIGTFSDKVKVLQLNQLLKNTSVETIFAKPEKATLDYLQDFGFSQEMINRFFKPFFAGIFLENQLSTSSRMFEFVYKMFGEGLATLPKSGIEAIPMQLKSRLNNTTFLWNTKVKSVRDQHIILENGTEIPTDFSIIATDANEFLLEKELPKVAWKSCTTLYFETNHKSSNKPLIGLIADAEALINNIFYHTSVQTSQSGGKELLSVTVVKKHNLSDEALQKQVAIELEQFCNIKNVRFIKMYSIKRALPDLQNLKYSLQPEETQVSSHIFLAGDTRLNGSLNAAMLAGESAALGVVNAVSKV